MYIYKGNGWSMIKKKVESLFVKLTIMNIIFVIIVSLVNSSFFYRAAEKNMKESFREYNSIIQSNALRNIDENIFQRLLEIPTVYYDLFNVNNPLYSPNRSDMVGNYTTATSIQDELQTILFSLPYVQDLDIYYPKTNTAITGSRNIHYGLTQEKTNQLLPWYESYYNQELPYYFLPCGDNSYPTNTEVITLVMKISPYLPKEDSISLALHIKPDKLKQYIDENVGMLVIAKEDGEIIYNGDNPNIQSMEDTEVVKIEFASTLFDLIYTYYIPYSVFYHDFHINTSFLILVCLGLLVVNIIFIIIITYFSDSKYKTKVKDYFNHVGVDMQGSQTIENSLAKVEEKIQALNHISETSQPLIHKNSIRTLILGRNIEEEYKKIEMYYPYECVMCIRVTLTKSRFENIQLESLEQMIEHNRDVDFKWFSTSMTLDHLLMVVLFHEADEMVVKNTMMKSIIEHDEGCKIAIGEVLQNSSEAYYNTYQTARITSSYHYIFTSKDILEYQELDIDTRSDHGSHLKMFANIERSLIAQNEAEFKWNIGLVVEALKCGNYTMDYCKAVLRDLIGLLHTQVQKSNFEGVIIFGCDIRKQFDRIENIDEYSNWMCELCEIYLSNLHQRDHDMDQVLKCKLVEYIEKNLQNDISLDIMADEFGMRTDTLSRICKNLLGQSYIDYVREKKLEKSIELICQGMSVRDVGETLGYNSTQYFIKIFKGKYGITPYQYYKEQLHKKQQS